MSKGSEIRRPMTRCTTCRSWWSGAPRSALVAVQPGSVDPERCGCGGELEAVDMQAHLASLPHKHYDPTKDTAAKAGSAPKPSS